MQQTSRKERTMSVNTTISAAAQPRRTWLVLVGVAAAATTVAALAALFVTGGTTRAGAAGMSSATTQPRHYNSAAMAAIMSLTPTRFGSGALGLGYALPTVQRGPSMAAVIASMSPETRAYTQAVMSQTFAQLAAGAAGSP
jgi:hypothetical protein